MAFYGAETWTHRAADQKHLASFEMWCWRRMEKISWTDHVRNEEVLLRVNEQRKILHKIRKRKANWIGHILRTRVGTLIVATIYLQLLQNRYMFRSFTVLQCSHQHCLQPVASDVEVVGYL